MVAALERYVVTPPVCWLARGAVRPARSAVRLRRRPASASPEQPEEASTEEISYGTLRFEPYGGMEEKPRVRVRFSVPFRCHSRQMLCVGGSQYPFGWSFVSIAKAPMTWNPRDIWTAEVCGSMGVGCVAFVGWLVSWTQLAWCVDRWSCRLGCAWSTSMLFWRNRWG